MFLGVVGGRSKLKNEVRVNGKLELTLRSEIITQLTPQKLFRAMITRISRNPS